MCPNGSRIIDSIKVTMLFYEIIAQRAKTLVPNVQNANRVWEALRVKDNYAQEGTTVLAASEAAAPPGIVATAARAMEVVAVGREAGHR